MTKNSGCAVVKLAAGVFSHVHIVVAITCVALPIKFAFHPIASVGTSICIIATGASIYHFDHKSHES
jgi:hypothetical protein